MDVLQDFFQKRGEVTDDLRFATELIKSRENLKGDLICLREAVSDISSKLPILREYLNKLKENCDTSRKLLSLQQELQEKILDMHENAPKELITAYANRHKSELTELSSNAACYKNICSEISFTGEDQHENVNFNYGQNVQEPIADCTKKLFNEPEPHYPRISLLKEEEYNKIPKYMVRRQPLDKINSIVIFINTALKAKYSLLSAGKDVAKKRGLLDTYLNYKKQDIICESCGCKYFFTAKDYENSAKVKLDRIALNMMTVLRHCKRIREYRLKNELFYIVL